MLSNLLIQYRLQPKTLTAAQRDQNKIFVSVNVVTLEIATTEKAHLGQILEWLFISRKKVFNKILKTKMNETNLIFDVSV